MATWSLERGPGESEVGSCYGKLSVITLWTVAVAVLAATVVMPSTVHAVSVGSAFTYQGQLAEQGTPVSGTCDFEFALFNAELSGTQIGSTVPKNGIEVSNGLFMVELDFGTGSFGADVRWLEVQVACPAGGTLETLSPRQRITPSPQSQYSMMAAEAMSAQNADTVDGSHADDLLDNTDNQGLPDVLGINSSAGGKGITNLANPTSGSDAATKSYVDGNDLGHVYKTHSFPTGGNTWNAITGLSSVTPVEVTIDANDLDVGSIFLSVDGVEEAEILPGSVLHRVVGASSSVSLRSVSVDPWDISAASFNTSFNVSGEDTAPTGVTFKSDGTKMFVVGFDGGKVYSYDLSTAWDISTASFGTSFDVSGQEINPRGVTFKSDGSKMFVVGTTGDNVYSYDLSTAWDISTASFNTSFNVSLEDVPLGVTFKSDGTKMFVVGFDRIKVYSYDLSTAWDISTVSFGTSFDVSGQENEPSGVTFKSDGTKMFVVGLGGDNVYSYDILYSGTAYASAKTE